LYLLSLNRFDDNYSLHFELPDAIRYVFEETQSRVLYRVECFKARNVQE